MDESINVMVLFLFMDQIKHFSPKVHLTKHGCISTAVAENGCSAACLVSFLRGRIWGERQHGAVLPPFVF